MLCGSLVILACAGCVTTGSQLENKGSQAGAGNGVLGGLFAGFASAGHAIGNAIGGVLNEVERQLMASATQRASNAKANQRISWSSKSQTTGKTTKGYVVPGEIHTKADGRQCRDIKQVIEKDGKTYEETKLTCKTSTGWEDSAL